MKLNTLLFFLTFLLASNSVMAMNMYVHYLRDSSKTFNYLVMLPKSQRIINSLTYIREGYKIKVFPDSGIKKKGFLQLLNDSQIALISWRNSADTFSLKDIGKIKEKGLAKDLAATLFIGAGIASIIYGFDADTWDWLFFTFTGLVEIPVGLALSHDIAFKERRYQYIVIRSKKRIWTKWGMRKQLRLKGLIK